MAAPAVAEHSVIIPISLDEMGIGDMCDLSVARQRRQRSQPFELFNMHWLLTIEKHHSSDGTPEAFDILAFVFCLSVSLVEDVPYPTIFKDEIPIPASRDGQNRSYNTQERRVCKLVGKNYPADGVVMRGVVVVLQSGGTTSDEAEFSLYNEDEQVGGFYHQSWRGMGGVLLRNHKPESWRDGKSIKLTVQFPAQPRPVCFVKWDD